MDINLKLINCIISRVDQIFAWGQLVKVSTIPIGFEPFPKSLISSFII